ncbi:MAG: hypothetical protein JW915_13145 [Chitinispirillaceae bacterium]|nr:hypothetical protein [Chitinispirillaceae bacterium]
MTNRFSLVILSLFLCPHLSISEIKIEENVLELFSENDTVPPAVYKTKPHFSQADLDSKLNFLRSTGFNPVLKDSGTTILYKDDSSNAIFSYSKPGCEYTYRVLNSSLKSFTDADRDNESAMQSIADTFLKGIMGNDAQNFELNDVSQEYAVIFDINNAEPILTNKTFFYVRVVDERAVLGMQNRILITLGKELRIVDFTMCDMSLEKIHLAEEKLTKTAMIDYLNLYLTSKTYLKKDQMATSAVITTTVTTAKKVYVHRQSEADTCLVPAISFTTTDSFSNGDSQNWKFTLQEDILLSDSIPQNAIIANKGETSTDHPICRGKNVAKIVYNNNGISISSNTPLDRVSVDLYTVSGQKVLSRNVTDTKHRSTFFLPLPNLPPGHYVGKMYCYSNGKMKNNRINFYAHIVK